MQIQATRLKLDQIFEMRRQGKRIEEIASAVDMPGATVAAFLECPAGKATMAGRTLLAR